jgi:hypothetical protein
VLWCGRCPRVVHGYPLALRVLRAPRMLHVAHMVQHHLDHSQPLCMHLFIHAHQRGPAS